MAAKLGYRSSVTATRPANTTAYTAGDVVGATAAALTFSNIGPRDSEMLVTSTELLIESSAVISGETSYRLHLYNMTPPSALADNAAFDLESGDRDAYLGAIDLGTPVDRGATLYVRQDIINAQIRVGGTSSIFGYLETVGAYTPASARVYRVTLHTVLF